MEAKRLEAFSDGVIAILITIMVLELRPPDGTSIGALGAVLPKFAAYALSFALVGIYWNNHHHLFQVVERIDAAVLWANMSLLFALSLVPFATAWLGEHPGATGPSFWYGVVALLGAITYGLMTQALLRIHDPQSRLARAIGADRKGRASAVVFAVSIPVALVAPWVTIAMAAAVAIVWLIPDRRITRILNEPDVASSGTEEGPAPA